MNSNEYFYRNLFINNRAIILLINPQTSEIVDANLSACSFYGYSYKEMLKLKITDINTLTEQLVVKEMNLAKEEQSNRFYFKHRLSSGQIRDVEVNSTPITFEGRNLLSSIVWDITDSKIYSNNLKIKNTTLEKVVAERTYQFEEANALLKQEILEHVKTEESLKQEMAYNDALVHMEAIINSISDGLIILDKNNKFTLLNQGGRDFFYQPEIIAKNGDSFKHTKYYDMQGKVLPVEDMVGSRVLRGEIVTQCTIKAVRPDKIVYFSMSGNPVYDSESNISHAVLCCRDITEQIESDLLIFRRKEQLEILFENISDGIYISDKDGKLLFLNSEGKKQLYHPDTINTLGDNYRKTGYSDMAGNKISFDNMPGIKALRGETVKNERLHIKHPDKEIFIEASTVPIYDNNGNLSMVAVCTHDITDLVEKENFLIQQKEQLDAIIENMSDALLIFDKEGHYTTLNKSARETYLPIYGYHVEKVGDGRELAEHYDANGNLIPAEDAPERRVRKGEKLIAYWMKIKADDNIIYTEVSGTPIYDKDGNFVTGVLCCRDLTGRVKMEKELINSQEEALKNKMEHEMIRIQGLSLIGTIAAGIGHEIRNPMTTVRGYLQLLGSKEELSKYIGQFALMIDELDRANSIITQFLSLAKDRVVELKVQSIKEIVENIFPLIQADGVISDKYIHLELDEVEEIPLDKKEIHQLILNLVLNGSQAMSPGGTIKIRTFMDKEEIVLGVQDDGKGITPEVLAKIGTPFFTTKENGTGLGLAVCYSIVARHNAIIDIETGLTGTTFFVRFKK